MSTTVIMPPLALVGADGAGKHTVATILHDLGDYRLIEPADAIEQEVVWQRVVTIPADDAQVQELRERGFRIVYVFAPPSMRRQRLCAQGRVTAEDAVPTDDTPADPYDDVISNYGSMSDLRWEIVQFLNKKAA